MLAGHTWTIHLRAETNCGHIQSQVHINLRFARITFETDK